MTPQPIRISFSLETDTRPAAASDDIADALDYGRAAEQVAELTRSGQFQLAETLAERIAEMLLAQFPAERVRVEVEKPAALPDTAGVGVAIERQRSDRA